MELIPWPCVLPSAVGLTNHPVPQRASSGLAFSVPCVFDLFTLHSKREASLHVFYAPADGGSGIGWCKEAVLFSGPPGVSRGSLLVWWIEIRGRSHVE